MANEEKVAYSQFRLDYNDYLNSEVPVEEKEDEYLLDASRFFFTTGSRDFLSLGTDERRFFVIPGDT